MSEQVFKPVAGVFALIHAGGAPYQWTTSAEDAVEWLKENPKHSVKEYVTLDRYQEAVSDDYATLKAERDALAAAHKKLRESMAAIHNTIKLDGINTSFGGLLSASKRAYEESIPTEAFANQLRAEGVEMLANRLQQFIDEGDFVGSEVGLISGAIDCGKDIAAQLRAQGGE